MEFLTPSWRTICGAISFWPPGEMLLGLLAYLIISWRLLTVVVALPALVLLLFHRLVLNMKFAEFTHTISDYFILDSTGISLFCRTILESPRWLLVRKKTTEAHQVFATIADWNGKPAPDIKLIEKLQDNVLKEESASVTGVKAIKMIMQSSKLRIHMTVLTLCNMTCGIVYYGVSFNARNLSGNPYLNMLYMGIFDFFGSPSSIWLNNLIGRRKTFTLFMGMGTIFIVSLLFVEATTGLNNSSTTLVTVLSLCGRFGIVAAWGALTCLILETAPTNLRSTCIGFAAFAAYLGAVVAPQVFLLSGSKFF